MLKAEGPYEPVYPVLRQEAVIITAPTTNTLTPERDVLSFNHYASALVELLLDKTTELPLTIGVFGERGSGKTSFFQLIQHQLKQATTTKDDAQGNVHYKWRLCDRGRGIPALLGVAAVVLFLLIVFVMACVGSGIALMSATPAVDNTDVSNITFNSTRTPTTSLVSKPEEDMSWLYRWIPLFVLAGVLTLLSLSWLGYYFCTKGYKRTPAHDLFDKFHRYLVMVFFWPEGLQFIVDDEAETEYITVTFTAWDYVQSSQLWAGIVTKLSDTIEDYFGSLLSRYFTILQESFKVKDSGTEGPQLHTKERVDSEMDGKVLVIPRRLFRFPKFATLAILLFLFLYCTFLLIIYSLHFDLTKPVATVWTVPAALIVSMAGLLAGFIRTLTTLRTLCRPLSWPILDMQGSSEGESISFEEELGYMHKVKDEVEKLNKMLIYMGWLFQRKFRVILFVDDLDRCSQENVAKMLEAIKIMLAKNANNNFVCIVTAGKQHLLDALESDKFDLGSQSGQKFLDDLFDIPFAMPPFSKVSGKKLLEQKRRQLQDSESENIATTSKKVSTLIEQASNDGLQSNTVGSSAKNKLYKEVLYALEGYCEYLNRNPRCQKRIILCCHLAALLAKDCTKEEVRQIVWAIILFDIWPFRSNLLYYYEEKDETGELPLKTVLDNALVIFSSGNGQYERSGEMLSNINNGLAHEDGKGEQFRGLLGDWTMKHLHHVISFTLNRDTALKRRIGKAVTELKSYVEKKQY